MTLALAVFVFGLSLWLGLYLIARNPADTRLLLPTAALLLLALLTGRDILATSPWLPPGSSLLLLVIVLPIGLLLAARNARQQGERLLPHLFRSFDYSFFTALLFGGQVALVMAAVTDPGATRPLLILLLTTITAAVAIQTLAEPFQSLLDRIAFFRFPQVRREQAALRAAADAATRADENVDFAALDEAEFAGLTRRAISYLDNPPRLAASPLTHLPLVAERLAQKGASAGPLERAAELRIILVETIEQLKPHGRGEFGVSDEWRHYNALYYPYVAGLKPYRRRLDPNGLDPAAQQALDWFRTQVPERTLYNWQQAAARLVAQHLRETLSPQ
jgi:hypothetical protein